MLSNYIKILFLTISLLFVGCTTNINNIVSESPPLKKKIKTQKALNNKELSKDIRASIYALILKMRGQTSKSGIVSFDPLGSHIIEEKKFKYKGFVWNYLNISKYEVISKTNNSVTIKLGGILGFRDVIGRFTSSTFSLEYEIKNKKSILVLNSYITSNFISKNMTKAYIVPLEKFIERMVELNDYASLFLFAQANAIRMKANENEIIEYNKLSFFDKVKGKVKNKPIRGKFIAMIFCLERFPESTSLILELDNSENVEAKYINENGWQIGIVGFQGEVRTMSKPFNINVYIKEYNSFQMKKIAFFNNKMSYKLVNNDINVLSNGYILLDPKNTRDAKIIQMRLAHLNYYKGKIDGDFGKGSISALQSFNKDMLNYNSKDWDINVQKSLFDGTGL